MTYLALQAPGMSFFFCLNNQRNGGMKMEKTTMNVRDLSIQMGISLPKAYELASSPGFPAFRIGKRILIPVDAYRDWLAEASRKNKE